MSSVAGNVWHHSQREGVTLSTPATGPSLRAIAGRFGVAAHSLPAGEISYSE
eukprot:COSAG01_NODE_4742_length_4773_cov_4.259521_5_plen_52_part_00